MNNSISVSLGRLQKIALIVAGSGAVLSAIGLAGDRHQWLVSFLFSYTFWMGLSLGCLAVAMMHHLTSGRWGFLTRRFLEAGFLTVPVMAVLFVPLLFDLPALYSWAGGAGSEIVHAKRSYLNPTGFTLRTIVFIATWILLAAYLRKWSLQQDTTSDPSPTERMRTLSGAGMVVYALTATFAFVDWVMSSEPEWYSTMFPVIVLIGQILTAFALIIVMLAAFQHHAPFRDNVPPASFHNLGNLLLAFVMLWTYVSFGQWLVIYSGNLPHEIQWYLRRITGGWKWLILLIAIFHFFVPFALLLFRATKRHPLRLAFTAALVLVFQAAAVFWTVVPAFRPGELQVRWTDLTVFLSVGGLWFAAFATILKRRPLLAQNDPRIESPLSEALHAK